MAIFRPDPGRNGGGKSQQQANSHACNSQHPVIFEIAAVKRGHPAGEIIEFLQHQSGFRWIRIAFWSTRGQRSLHQALGGQHMAGLMMAKPNIEGGALGMPAGRGGSHCDLA